jgi:hypothetical protein
MEEEILDDSDLLRDRLLRSLHRDQNGHLAASRREHKNSVADQHNVAVLFLYSKEDEAYTLHEYYMHHPKPANYWSWRRIVVEECKRLYRNRNWATWHGVYGWFTTFIQITPMRTNDLFIKVDATGATGVRLSFNRRGTQHETRTAKKAKQR